MHKLFLVILVLYFWHGTSAQLSVTYNYVDVGSSGGPVSTSLACAGSVCAHNLTTEYKFRMVQHYFLNNVLRGIGQCWAKFNPRNNTWYANTQVCAVQGNNTPPIGSNSGVLQVPKSFINSVWFAPNGTSIGFGGMAQWGSVAAGYSVNILSPTEIIGFSWEGIGKNLRVYTRTVQCMYGGTLTASSSCCNCDSAANGCWCETLDAAPTNDNKTNPLKLNFPVKTPKVAILTPLTTNDATECLGQRSVWFNITGIPIGKRVKYSTCGYTSADTVIGKDAGNGSLLCYDDQCGSQSTWSENSTSSFSVIQVGARNANSTYFTVCLEFTGPYEATVNTSTGSVSYPYGFLSSEVSYLPAFPGWCQAMNYTVTWFSNSACANMTQLVTIQPDTTPPVVSSVPADMLLSCSTGLPTNQPTYTDSTPPVTAVYSVTNTTRECPGNYTVFRTWNVSDSCGNWVTKSQTVNFYDKTPPVVSVIPTLNAQCNALPMPNATAFGASDTCYVGPRPVFTFMGDTMSRTTSGSAKFITVTRNWRASDNCNNFNTFTQSISITDSIAPVFSGVPANTTVACSFDATSSGGVTAFDACDNSSVSVTYNYTVTNGSCPYRKTIIRKWTAKDFIGNTATAVQQVDVVDNSGPAFIGAPASVNVICEAIPSVPTVTAVDTCSGSRPVSYYATPSNGFCSPTVPVQRTWTSTDTCGNTATYTQVINCSGYTPIATETLYQPQLVSDLVHLDETGNLHLAFTWPVVLTRNLTDAYFVGSTKCREGQLGSWTFTSVNSCNPFLEANYAWNNVTQQCFGDLRVTNTSTGFITWFTPELTYTELISVEDGGKKRLAPRTTTLTREYVSDYPLGIQNFDTISVSGGVLVCGYVPCTPSDQCHGVNPCDPVTGLCAVPGPALADGTTCDDGNLCTQTDSCQSGVCTGFNPVPCTSNDQCYDAFCHASNGTCYTMPKANGAGCDDGNSCTQTDTCQSGICVGSNPKTCSPLDQCHVAGTCDPSTGSCSNPNATDGTSCDDSDPCTLSDVCTGGSCGGSQKPCPAIDQCHDDGVCNSLTGLCSTPTKTTGTSCDDGDGCSLNDICYGGSCVSYDTKDCSVPLSSGYGAGSCVNGSCYLPPLPPDTPCDDGDACTQTDQADGNGNCVGSNPVVCTTADSCHDVGTCNPATGQCSTPTRADGATCSDGIACTEDDTCQAGVCVGSPIVCISTVPCQESSCVDGSCTLSSAADGTSCDDEDLCTQIDTCTSGACVGSNNVVCTGINDCYENNQCDSTTGHCMNVTKASGESCSDGNACTQTDLCDGSGNCVGSNPVDCSTSNQCETTGTCNPSTGVCSPNYRSSSASCDDNNACTLSDHCDGFGACIHSSTVTCSPTSCHDVTCNTANGNCDYSAQIDGTSCDDYSACTSSDHCSSGTCVGTTVTCNTSQGCSQNATCDPGSGCHDPCTSGDLCLGVVCTALDNCHNAGTCDMNTGLCSNPKKTDGTSCSDENACTQTDTCQNGVCVGSNAITCTDTTCLSYSCNTTSGSCMPTPISEGLPCSDGNACSLNDICTSGVCSGTSSVTCSASDQCHDAGTCNPTDGTCSNPAKSDGSSCSDGDACTLGETCISGSCSSGTPKTCSPDNCHTATCHSSNGTCIYTPKSDGTSCSDSDPCTLGDTCQSGTCQSGTPKDCSNLTQCQQSGSCNSQTGLCTYTNKVNGASCDDSNACTLSDTCDGSGNCVPGSSKSCPANTVCENAGTCNPSNGQCSPNYKADTTSCDDSDPCTLTDQCASGICVGTPKSCGAPACQVGHCNSTSGSCYTTEVAFGTSCDDGNLCTTSDHCSSGSCVGDAVICSPLDQCHNAGTCNPSTGQCSNPNKADDSTCDDSNLCTQTDLCKNGTCQGSNPVTCTPQDQCHNAGTCNPSTGYCSNPSKTDGTSCNDGLLCTDNDVCTSGVCAGTTHMCSPIAPCPTAGVCLPWNGQCTNPCPVSSTTGAVISQTIKNQMPFHIVFATFTTDNITLATGQLIHAPYGLNYTLALNASQNVVKGSITTQYWYFDYFPANTCVLGGVYTFAFQTSFGYNYTLTFTLESQNFCGTIVNATVYGTLDIFSDDARTLPTTTFNEGDNIYFTITVSSAIEISSMSIISAGYGTNSLSPSLFTQESSSDVTVMKLFTTIDLTHFSLGTQYLTLDLKLTYVSPVKRDERDVSMDIPETIVVSRKLNLKPSPDGQDTPDTNNHEETASSNDYNTSSLLLGIVGFLGGSICIIGLVIASYIYRRRKQQAAYAFAQ